VLHPASILGRGRRTHPELLFEKTLQQPVPPAYLEGQPPAGPGQLHGSVALVLHQPPRLQRGKRRHDRRPAHTQALGQVLHPDRPAGSGQPENCLKTVLAAPADATGDRCFSHG